MGKKNIERWSFTVTSLRTGRAVRITMEAKRTADVIDALARLRAPMAVVRLVRSNGLGAIRRFNWDTDTSQVRGQRV